MTINKIFLFLLLILLIVSSFLLGRYSNNKWLFDKTFVSNNNHFDRGKYINDVNRGNSESALILARYYGSLGIAEAELYWFKKAYEMGDRTISKEIIDACERGVFDEWRN
jgi:hypothetical protein